MVYLRNTGRLGNQLFQYACARSVSLQTGMPLAISFEGDFPDDALADFCTQYTRVPRCKRNPLQGLLRSAAHFMRFVPLKNDRARVVPFLRKCAPLLNFFGVYYYAYGYYAFRPAHSKSIWVEGYFETPRYADAIRDTLLEEFTPKHPPRVENAALYARIAETNSVCVSVRRGDFLSGENAAECDVCSTDYFRRAVAHCEQALAAPVYFVFSDDVAWARDNLPFPAGRVYYESGLDPVWEKLRLMYSCKHFVLSNSTFSWWAQYLSRNEGQKLVIAPSRWRNTEQNDEIYCPGWVLLNPDPA